MQLNVWVSRGMCEELRREGELEGISRSDVVRRVLNTYLRNKPEGTKREA